MSAVTALVILTLATPPDAPASDAKSATAGSLHPRLEMLEAGVEDRGGIEASFRVLPVDMRLPSGFQGVYRVPGREDLMMRGNGALFAIFPRSQYRRAGAGLLPVTPADLHYSIGMPGGFNYPGGFLRDDVAPPDPRIASRVAGRVRLKPVEQVEQQAERKSEPGGARDVGHDAATPLNAMPAISEAARAKPAAAIAPAPIKTIDDLKLGPPVLARE